MNMARAAFGGRLHSNTVVAAPPAQKDSTLADIVPGQLTLERMCDERTLLNWKISATQRALVRATDGNPIGGILDVSHMITHFGVPEIPVERPKVVIPMAGIRAGKTRLSAMALLYSVLTCATRHVPDAEELARGVLPDDDGMTGIAPGERVRALIVAPRENQGEQAMSYVKGAMVDSPRLRKLIVENPTKSITIRRPCDGVEVIIEMVAASPRGTNIRSSWLAGIIYDEAAFWGGDQDAVNLKDNVDAGTSRLLPGAQAWLPSSAWADSGYYFEKHKAAMKAPTGSVLGFTADSLTLNPSLDAAEIAKAYLDDPLEASREYGAVPLSTLSSMFFPPTVLDPCINKGRPLHLGPFPGAEHYAGTDLGFRRNSSTLAIARAEEPPRVRLAYHEEFVPERGTPLVPSVVCLSFGTTCQGYGARTMRGDLAHADTAKEHLNNLEGASVSYDEYVPTQDRNSALFTRLKEVMSEGNLELPNDPRLISQLKGVMGRPMPGGRMAVIMPKQGQAHGDLVVALAHAVVQAADGARVVHVLDAKWDAYMPKFDTF